MAVAAHLSFAALCHFAERDQFSVTSYLAVRRYRLLPCRLIDQRCLVVPYFWFDWRRFEEPI